MTQRPKKHHYIPKGILKHFCYRNQSKLWYHDKSKTRGVESKDKENVFYKKHYYTVTDSNGFRDASAETQFFQKIDDKISCFIDQLNECNWNIGNIEIDSDTSDFVRMFMEYYTKRRVTISSPTKSRG